MSRVYVLWFINVLVTVMGEDLKHVTLSKPYYRLCLDSVSMLGFDSHHIKNPSSSVLSVREIVEYKTLCLLHNTIIVWLELEGEHL